MMPSPTEERTLPRLEPGATVVLPTETFARVLEVYGTGRSREVLVSPEDERPAFRIRACHLKGP